MAMNRRKQNRLIIIAAAGAVLSVAASLSLYAMKSKIVFFKSPSDIVSEGLGPSLRVRVGGLVKTGSWQRNGTSHVFVVTDTAKDLTVRYNGIMPDLFREGQGVVLDGSVQTDGAFVAETVLAKHDENYIPAEVAAALKAQGHWQEDGKAYGTKDSTKTSTTP